MDAQKLLEAPKPQPKIVARVSKVNNLVKVSTEARKTSTKLRKTFEKGIYQRKTQLSVLNRYKNRLDSIQKEKDRAYQKKTKKTTKEKLKVPKFKGSFFSKSGDPLFQIAALAGLNSLEKLLEGDLLGALSPGMVAAGALMAPGLLGLAGGAIEGFFGRGPKPQRGFDVTGRRVSTSAQNRYRQRFGDKAFKNRFGKDALKRSQQTGDVVSTATKGGRAARSFGRFGASIIPGVGAVVGAADAAIRASEGDVTGAAISGAGASLDSFAAVSAATGVGLPLAGLASMASFALDLTNLTRDLIGASDKEIEKNRLKTQTEKEKKLAEAKGNLTFTKTLDSYSTALVKFEEFSKEFTKGLFMSPKDVKLEAARVESRGAGSTPINGAGYEFTQKASFSQYLTGDPSSPGYDAAHGTVGNYHDHVAFKDRDTMQRAAAYLISKGIKVTEMNVSSGHTPGSAHYDGRAFDVPGSQWNGSGPIGPTEYNGSKRVRSLLNEFYESEGSHGGNILSGPKGGYFALLHGKEAVLPVDNQHTQSGGDPLENVSPDILNAILNKSKVYQMAMAEMPPEVIEVPMPVTLPQATQVQSSSPMSINIQDDADKKLLKMLYYSALG